MLKVTQHRYREKKAVSGMGIPVADFHLIDSAESLERLFFYPGVLKTTVGGYDGKGQLVIKSKDDFAAAKKLAENSECIIEKWIPFDK